MSRTISFYKIGMIVLIVLKSNTILNSQNYCSSSGSTYTDEYIGRVLFADIGNSSGPTPYTDFTSLVGNFFKGNAYSFTITVAIPGGQLWTEYCNVFIDYNNNGDFTDAGETINVGARNGPGDITATISIPSSISNGIHRMRVTMSYGGYSQSCGVFSYGEVEDYFLNITGGCTDIIAPTISLSAAATSGVINGPISLSAITNDNIAVIKVEFYDGINKLGEMLNYPFSLNWNPLKAGSKSITAKAFDACGNSTISNVIIIPVINYCNQ